MGLVGIFVGKKNINAKKLINTPLRRQYLKHEKWVNILNDILYHVIFI